MRMILAGFFFFTVFFSCPYMIDPFWVKMEFEHWFFSIDTNMIYFEDVNKADGVWEVMKRKMGQWWSRGYDVCGYIEWGSPKNSKVLQNLFVKLMVWFSGDSCIYSKTTVTKGRRMNKNKYLNTCFRTNLL